MMIPSSINFFISIHAPLAGCDLKTRQQMPENINFNPRTPCGVRRFTRSRSRGAKRFQSTHPLRGATVPDGAAEPARRISIHAPLAGCDFHVCSLYYIVVEFQSTHPLRGATFRVIVAERALIISIHAPLAGCDMRSLHIIMSRLPFQSTHPLRGATRGLRAGAKRVNISIHAPLAGCDRHPLERQDGDARHFNPRTPCGVRPALLRRNHQEVYFNPRTPCGVRLAHPSRP